ALLEKPYLFASAADKKANKEVPSPADQCELFAAIAKNSASFSEEEFITAQNSIMAKYLKLTGDSVECMKLLADWWALDSSMGSEGFYERFLNLMRDIKFAERQQIADEIKKEEPYTFVLLNSEVYQKSKAAFDQKGYTHITTQNASWYSDELEIQKALQMEQKQLRKAERQMSAGIEVSPLNTAEYFFYKNAPLIQTTKLANGIPLTVKTTADSRTALLSIAISGGECASPEKERLLRTVMVNSFARNIQTLLSKQKQQNTFVGIPEILAWTQQRVSYITIECLSCDLPAVFKAASDAVIFGEMDAVIADSLVHEQKAQWASTIIGLGNQLNFNALKYLYRGTPYERLYDTETEVLKETSLSSITNAYTHLLNATLYSLVVVGDVKFNEIEKYAESSFGILKSIGSRAKVEFPKAEFKNKTRRVQLRHLYATDKTPEMAPNGVPILVPTKDFFDPVLYYFQCPEEKKQRVLFNALLIELSARTQEFLKAQKSDIKCSYTLATPSVQVGMLKADAVLHTNSFYGAYKKAFNALKNDLSAESGMEGCVRAIKAKWISDELSKTQTNPGTAELIQQGLLEGNASEYLSSYMTLEGASAKMFLDVLERYLPEDPIFKVFSVDSKK
ncbi:MAG: insulinase family protein, partial [Treponema sp.]|nr:insulinase family protein [Treponema sp.]